MEHIPFRRDIEKKTYERRSVTSRDYIRKINLCDLPADARVTRSSENVPYVVNLLC